MEKKKEQIHVEYWPVEQVMPYGNNARAHGEDDIDAIMTSIKEFGFNDPIGIWKGIIVEGHGRLMAAKRLGMEAVPVIILDHLTDEQRRAYALAHNKTAELSEWDFNMVDAELADIADIDMSQFGFDVESFGETAEAIDDDYEPVIPEEPVSQKGKIWILGNHRLMCGDSASENDMSKLFEGGVSPKLVFTDPPYGVAIGDKNKMLDSFQKA